MATIDNNTWYQFENLVQGPESGQQTGQFNGSYSVVFGSPFDNTNNYQSWQIINSSTTGAYNIRARSTGPYLYFNSARAVQCGDGRQGCVFCTQRTCDYLYNPVMLNDLGPAAQWYIEPWGGDSGYYMYNAANGSSWHLELQDNGSYITLTDELTQSDAQSWDFPTVGAIDDEDFSTVSPLPPSTTYQTVTATAPVSTTSATPSTNSSSGLSSGVKGAIGGAIGGVALVVLIILGLWYLRRRKKRRAAAPTHQNYSDTKYPAELQDTQVPAELPDSSFREMPDTSSGKPMPNSSAKRS